jgi:hypothetical protein
MIASFFSRKMARQELLFQVVYLSHFVRNILECCNSCRVSCQPRSVSRELSSPDLSVLISPSWSLHVLLTLAAAFLFRW